MVRNKSAVATYKYYSTLEGNQHIASQFALSFINSLFRKFKIQNVLELGLGIGSICYSVHNFCEIKGYKISYSGTESNPFCLGVLPKYLKTYFNTLDLYTNLDQVPTNKKFDLLIIDGKENNLDKVKELTSTHGIILIEGDRLPQLEIIRNVFPKSTIVRVISLTKNPNYGPFSSNHWCGGVQLVFIHPTFIQKIYHFYLKMTTAIKYKLRRFKQ